jgi:hypothetical protein
MACGLCIFLGIWFELTIGLTYYVAYDRGLHWLMWHMLWYVVYDILFALSYGVGHALNTTRRGNLLHSPVHHLASLRVFEVHFIFFLLLRELELYLLVQTLALGGFGNLSWPSALV